MRHMKKKPKINVSKLVQQGHGGLHRLERECLLGVCLARYVCAKYPNFSPSFTLPTRHECATICQWCMLHPTKEAKYGFLVNKLRVTRFQPKFFQRCSILTYPRELSTQACGPRPPTPPICTTAHAIIYCGVQSGEESKGLLQEQH